MYKKQADIRWSDMDPNFHLRHSVYYDLGASTRISFLNDNGFTPNVLLQNQIGPILFREECVFKREVRFHDKVEIDLRLQKCRKDGSRWTMVHQLWKNETSLSAIITVDGAWIDLVNRKLAIPPAIIMNAFNTIPKTEDFKWLD